MTINAGFTWNNNVPNAPNNPSVDQPNMLTNTQSDNSIWAVDHIGYNAVNGGIHNVIRFNNQAADPAAIAGFGQLYTKTLGADQQLYYESGAGVVSLLSGMTQTVAASGNIKFPGGLIIQWGSAIAAPDNTLVTFSIPFPANLFALDISHSSPGAAENTGAIVSAASKTLSNFRVRVSGSSGASYSYIAIGN